MATVALQLSATCWLPRSKELQVFESHMLISFRQRLVHFGQKAANPVLLSLLRGLPMELLQPRRIRRL